MLKVVSSRRLRAMVWYFLSLVILILSISCFVEWIAGADLTDGNLRATAKPLFRGFSGFGETLIIVMPFFASLSLSIRRRREAFLCGAIAVAAWAGVLETSRRAPLVGGAIGILFFVVGIAIRGKSLHNCPKRLATLALAFVATTALHSLPTRFTMRSGNPLERLHMTTPTEPNTNVRLLFWGIATEMWRTHPLIGVGANNFEIVYPEARASLSQSLAEPAFANLNEALLAQYAHGEYFQIAAELGTIGLAFVFLLFVGTTILTQRATLNARNYAAIWGLFSGLIAFIVSSVATPFSFRWTGSGVVFFFCVTMIAQTAKEASSTAKSGFTFSKLLANNWLPLIRKGELVRSLYLTCLTISITSLLVYGQQAISSTIQGMAESALNKAEAEKLYNLAITIAPWNASGYWAYGMWLYAQGRAHEAAPHFQRAVENGFNSTFCYAYLAAAQGAAGDLSAAEKTCALMAKVYPHSVFARTRYALALTEVGKLQESEAEFAEAKKLDKRGALGWMQLMRRGPRVAFEAARVDGEVAAPSELRPEVCIFPVLSELAYRCKRLESPPSDSLSREERETCADILSLKRQANGE